MNRGPHDQVAAIIFYQHFVGLCICLLLTSLEAYSYLSFFDGRYCRVRACHSHRLREYMIEHPEVREILRATD